MPRWPARSTCEFGMDEAGEERILLAGDDVTRAIRTETAGAEASRVAAMPPVRSALLDRQHAFARPPGLVADGRDMGTVVFPGGAAQDLPDREPRGTGPKAS